MPSQTRSRRRQGGRRGNVRKSMPAVVQRPWVQPVYRDQWIEPLDEEGVHRIHDGAMRMLEEVGLEIHHDEALTLLRDAGAIVDFDTKHVRIGRDIIMAAIASAPSTFDLEPRNPARRIQTCRTSIAGGAQATGRTTGT